MFFSRGLGTFSSWSSCSARPRLHRGILSRAAVYFMLGTPVIPRLHNKHRSTYDGQRINRYHEKPNLFQFYFHCATSFFFWSRENTIDISETTTTTVPLRYSHAATAILPGRTRLIITAISTYNDAYNAAHDVQMC